MNYASSTLDPRYRLRGGAPLMSAPIFSTSVATSAVGESFGNQTNGWLMRKGYSTVGLEPLNNFSVFPATSGVRPVGAWYDDLWSTVSPAVNDLVKGGIQLGQTALQNLVVKGQRKLGVTDSDKVFVDPQTGKAYPIVTQNGSIFLRDEYGNLKPYLNQNGYVTTQADILGTAKKYGPWIAGAVGVGLLVWFATRRRR